ncbi:MAG TPA: metalloregulator ArsR/SmtB family transcription factor [Chloroflexota bacterium]|jgi:DNA-binding transcriptional ArsR family regulator
MGRHETAGAEQGEVRCIHPADVANARAGLEAEETYRLLAELFGALADPTRARVVHTLLRQELCTCDIAAVVGISESGASQHLRVLRSLRLVKARRAGKFVYYSLDDEHIALLVRVGLIHLGHVQPVVARLPAVAGERAG